MLEGLAAWVLNNYLGRYVENLNTDQLSIGLLKGEVELECLPLRKDTFNLYDLPVQVVAGYVGKIRLKIPVTRIKSEPWVISVEQLYIVIGPQPKDDYDEEKEQEKECNRKMNRLDLMEAEWRSEHDAKQEASYYASSYSSWVSYGASFVSNIIENLQLKVRDVHIRYEDDLTTPLNPVACGITIESLTVQSANDMWVPQFVQKEGGEATRKLVELKNMAFYWDVSNVTVVGSLNFQELAIEMHKLLLNKGDAEKTSHDFILQPVCAKARLQRNCDNNPLKSRLTPRINCDIFVDSFYLSLNEHQYGSVVNWSYEFQRYIKAQPYLKWRPKELIFGHAKEWWQFAARPIVENIKKRKNTCNWDFLLIRARHNVLYVKAYIEHLINPVACSPEFREHKNWMEQEIDFKELKILRELAMEKVAAIEEAQRNKNLEVKGRNAGLLQRWFPLWTGWYSGVEKNDGSSDGINDSSNEELDSSRILEEEILDVLNDSVEETDSLFCRDYVFARLNFNLKTGVFVINNGSTSESLANLELTSVSIGLELRPRARSTLFDLSLGALHLKDMMNKGSLFPFIAAPQNQQVIKTDGPTSLASFMSIKRVFPWVMSNADSELNASTEPEEPLFRLVYEVRPLRSNADYKLHMQSRSLDVVYNASIFHRIRDFFGTPHRLAAPASSSSKQRSRLGEELAAVANKVKQQTKEELLKNWDQLLKGYQSLGKRWDIHLNISTPQIIIPESFSLEDTTMVVFNFGRFKFFTDSCQDTLTKVEATSPSLASYYNDDEEEVFRTPFSTPPGELAESPIKSPAQFASSPPTSMSPVEDLTESSLLRRMYDRYTLHFSDLQILVTKAKTNWKYAYLQGTSTSHVVNRFSIYLQLEKRVVHTVDPKWPRVKISGDLPTLVIHIDELKIDALKNCWSTFSTFTSQSPEEPSTFNSLSSNLDLDPELDDKTNSEALLLVTEFQIGQMSIDVQSVGRSLAELQVINIKSSINKRPFNTAVCFTVQSLLLVDALQTFGSDFELLVASHKNIILDSVSGSMRDSEPTSPSSPASPSSNLNSGAAININAAIKQLETNQTKRNAYSPLFGPLTPVYASDVEALIVVEYTIVKTASETTRLVSVQFNNLDFIANQQTITELAKFFKRYNPKSKPSSMRQPMWESASQVNVNISFEFHRLSVLLMHIVPSLENGVATECAHKIATLTLTDASIQASFDQSSDVQGSLGGVHLIDLSHDRSKYCKILSVGRDPSDKRHQSLVEQLQADLYASSLGVTSSEAEAFHFSLKAIDDASVLCIRMATVKCVYSTAFWTDLTSCVNEFHHYAAQVGGTLKNAATEVAREYLNPRNGDLMTTQPLVSRKTGLSSLFTTNSLRLNVIIDSPILVVPESSHSDWYLQAHLGKITVNNVHLDPTVLQEVRKRIVIEIRDMNLFLKQHESGHQDKGSQIIHDAALEITLDWYTNRTPIHLEVLGKVVTSLKVSLIEKQYERILRIASLLTSGIEMPKSSSQSSASQPQASDTKVCVTVVFQLPSCSIDLKSDSTEERGLVGIVFNHFVVDYKHWFEEPIVIDISLDSVTMEDYLVPPESKHRFLLISSSPMPKCRKQRLRTYISSSCPDITSPRLFLCTHSSLPDKLDTESVFHNMKRFKEKMMYGGNIHRSVDDCPTTPPPSPLVVFYSTIYPNALVHVKICFLEANQSRSNEKERVIDISFNCLDVIIKHRPWKVVFDFFLNYESDEQRTGKMQKTVNDKVEVESQVVETVKTNIHVKRLSVLLVRDDQELANLVIANVTSNIVQCKDLEVEGTLGRMSLMDLTQAAKFYKERFTTFGDEALVYKFFKYKSTDLKLSRDFDASLNLTMGEVHYVHTNRFYIEVTHFLKTLLQFHHSSEPKKCNKGEDTFGSRCLRYQLKIKIESPSIFLPVALWSKDFMMTRLDQLLITNSFVMNEGCLLDISHIKLKDMELCIGKRTDSNKYTIRGAPLLSEKFRLDLQMERNLDNEFNKSVPDVNVKGSMSALKGALNAEQYTIVKGILEHNIGEQIESHLQSSVTSSRLVKTFFSEGWTQLLLQLKLVDVTLDFLDHSNSSLAKVNFINSELTYRSTSYGFSEVDLVSREILISDTRFNTYPANNRPNVFCNILQATRTPTKVANGKQIVSTDVGSSNYLQAELHYRANRDFRRLTVLLNHMRVIAILDWWTDALKLLSSSVEAPESAKCEPVYQAVCQPSGVITRHESMTTNELKTWLPFELKINMTDTGIVIVEESDVWDSNAIILETTSIINYSPSSDDKPFWCTVHRLEVFSCILGMEEDTALSIIDPVINADLVLKKKRRNSTVGAGLKELTSFKRCDRILEISVTEVNVKVSYHDLRLFVRIMDSLPHQLKYVFGDESKEKYLEENDFKTVITAEEMMLVSKIAKLEGMGYSHGDSFRALTHCNLDVMESALWLTQNATVESKPQLEISDPTFVTQDEPIELKVHISALSVCLIDDCKDADVPLIEFILRNLLVEQKSLNNDGDNSLLGVDGCARGRFECDYYNRSLSGWEPLVEPFGFKANWRKEMFEVGKQSSLSLSMDVDDLVDINLTSTLLNLYKNVKTNWTEDYYKQSDRMNNYEVTSIRRRSPFVPFALKNSTGCQLYFTTMTTDQFAQYNSEGKHVGLLNNEGDRWKLVEVDQVVPFSFEGRLRKRHMDKREARIHQLSVKVDGWQQVTPVSVDKVGIFFRDAKPAVVGKLNDLARIVFQVTLEGSARKLITVRSALMVQNSTETTMEIRLDSSKTLTPVNSIVIHLKPSDCFPVPLSHITSLIYCRPYDNSSSFLYCCSPIRWQHVINANGTQEDTYFCSAMNPHRQTHSNSRDFYFRFCARVHRDNYPLDIMCHPANVVCPAHSVIILPPLIFRNLLPFDLLYRIADVEGVISPGKKSSIHYLNVTQAFKIDFEFESSSFQTFKLVQEFEVLHGCTSFSVIVEMKDNQNRSLLLHVKGMALQGGSSLEISVGAEYWIINRTGLPLIFKQEGCTSESAGQSSDNEKARSVAPLLFSFADRDAPFLCTVRVGRMLHPSGEPRWCRHFNLQKGVQFRRLYVLSRSARPDWVYSIGIDVRIGPAKYGDVFIVTLTPRFQLNNHSSHRLEFSQKYALESDLQLADVRLSALQNSCLPFHWPRLDQEQLLCVRISDASGCSWSGGFHIEKIDSFHISMRDDQARPVFLRVEVVLLGATYTVVFTDTDNLPPPYLLQNFCEVPIICHQTQASAERLRITVRPNTAVPYAWDEPTCDPFMTCIAPGGSSASFNLNVFGECKQQLSYENFIYIAFTETFSKSYDLRQYHFDSTEVGMGQLVLTVPTGTTKVILRPKEKGNRSQLWRMTSDGMLQHEGSSPPRNARKLGNNSSGITNYQGLVLDIAEIALQPDRYTPLALKKPNPQRYSTQTWEFSEDGRLRCRHHNVFVQCADGYKGLVSGYEVVIGPLQPVIYATTSKGIPVEQAINRHRLYPGSGLVCLRVIPDGPTRVLQILDITKKSTSLNVESGRETLDEEESANIVSLNWQVKIWLPIGLGISVINHNSEECLYARFVNIMLEYTQTKKEQCLNGSVQDFQVDNHLFDAECPVVLFMSANGGGIDEPRNFHPAISFVGSRINIDQHHLNINIFRGFQLQIKNITLMIEEKLLYKILQFMGYCGSERWDEFEDGSQESQGLFKASSVALAKRYYFGNFKLTLEQVRLSVITSSNLNQDLKSIKTSAGLTLVGFEDALVELDPFIRSHSCETFRFLVDSVLEHYKEELKSQAAKILGAVDFLGNPLGLVNDLSEGLSELLNDGNVGGLLKNVTHGISNSAAKMTGTLSDGLSLVTMDERHLENRRRIQSAHSGEHMLAGFKGLGFGLYSGITSIVTQTYEGATSEGLQGFFTGFGKGLVGTFTKPAAGFLDLASSAASAVRDTSKSRHRKIPEKVRGIRLCIGPGGLLPKYSADQSRGLAILYQLNDKDYSEMLIAIEGLNYSTDGLFALISSTKVYFLSLDPKNLSRECVLTIPLKDLCNCKPISDWQQGKLVFYLELTVRGGANSSLSTDIVYRPRVLCDTENIAFKVSQQINYAKCLYEEMIFTLTTEE